MGVYIRGMEMPESCIECPFKWAADSMTYCLAQTPTMKTLMPVKLHEIRWKKFSNAVEKFRWKEASCPLVSVPPHGRLIDADAFLAEQRHLYCENCARKKGMKNGKMKFVYDIGDAPCRACGYGDVLDDIEDAPTIIPANEEGE